jgi:hypothetical protein
MKTFVNQIGPPAFPRFIIVSENNMIWDGDAWTDDVRLGVRYAHQHVAEADAAAIESDLLS